MLITYNRRLLTRAFAVSILSVLGGLTLPSTHVWGQTPTPEGMVMPLTVSVDILQTCPNLDLVTFTLGGLNGDPADIVDVAWTVTSVSGNNNGSYVLDPAGPGPTLADWSLSTSLAFTPSAPDTYQVSAIITYAGGTSQNTLVGGAVEVGHAPTPPFISPFNNFFCESAPLEVQTSAANPDNLPATLCWEVIDEAGVTIGSGCEGPTTQTILTENVGITDLNEGCFEFVLTYENLCGTEESMAPFEVLRIPEFTLSSGPMCGGDDMEVNSTLDLSDYATCDGTPATGVISWSNNASTDPALAVYPGIANGTQVTQTASITYTSGGNSETCTASASTNVLVHVPNPMEWEVTYPVTFPPACSGDDIEVTATGEGTFVWNVTPLPASLSGGVDPITGALINVSANFENVQAPGISGTLIRTITFFDGWQCMDTAAVDIDISPRPQLTWVDDDFLAICEDSVQAAIEAQVDQFNSAPLTLTWEVMELTTGQTATLVSTLSQADLDAGQGAELLFDDLASLPGFLVDFDTYVPSLTSSTIEISLTAQDLDGCASLPILAEIQYFDVPTPQAVFYPACEGSIVVPDSVPVGGYSYWWEVNGSPIADATTWQPDFVGLTCEDIVTLTMSASYLTSPTDTLYCDANTAAFQLEIIPQPQIQVTATSSICVGEDLVLEAVDMASQDESNAACATSDTQFFWEYTTDGLVWVPGQFGAPVIGPTLEVPGGDFTTLEYVVTAIGSVDSLLDLSCTSVDTFSLDLLPLPTVDAWLVPDSACYDETVTVDVLASSLNGAIASYTWSPCVDETDELAIDNLGVDGSDALVTLTQAASLPTFACVVVELVDEAGCVATDSTEWWVNPVPTVDGLNISSLAANLPVEAVCDCSDSVVFSAVNPFLGTLPIDEITFDWTATWNDGTPLDLIQNGDNEAIGFPCLDEFANFCDLNEVPTLTVDLVVSARGCEAAYTWTDTLQVVPNPQMVPSCPPVVCANQPWDCVIEGPNFVLVGPNGEYLFEDDACSVDILVPWACIDPAGFSDLIVGGGVWPTPSGDTLVCTTTTSFDLTVLNVSTPTVSCSDTSGPSGDCVVCEGSEVTFQSSITNGNHDYTWFLDGVLVGDGPTLTLTNPVHQGDCSEPHVAGVQLLYEQNYNPSITTEVCPVEVFSNLTVLPTPVANGSVLNPAACAGDDVQACVDAVCGVLEWNGNAMTWDWSAPGGGNSGSFEGATGCASATVNFNAPDCSETTAQAFAFSVSDGYGCVSDPLALAYTVLELPELTFTGEFVCSKDSLVLEVCGADLYEWGLPLGTDAYVFDNEPAPTACCPGDALETLVHLDPLQCNVPGIDVVGSLVYEVGGETILCSASKNYNCVVYTNPVIEPSVNPVDAVLCEGDLMAFEDLNTAAGNIAYDFVTDQGFEQLGTAADNCEFEMFVPGTCFEVVKTQSFATQGITTLCTATWDSCFVVNPVPVISLTHPDAICQGELANVGVEVTNWDASCTYDCSLNNLQGGFVAGDNDDPSDNFGALCDFMLTNTSGIDVASSPSMSLELVVTDCKGCVSAPAQVTVDVYATPITAVVDSLYDTMCSPTSDCVQLDILNEGLPVGTLTEYFWENNPGTLSSQYCDNFVNSTPCPMDQTVEWTVRFTHQAADGSNVYCTSSNLDSTVVFPTPEPSFEFVSPQICYDPEGDNCAEIIHDVANYDVCPTDTLMFEWYTSAVAPLIQNQVHLTNPTAVVPVVCADSVGVFEVILEATNSYGCSQTTQAQEFTIRELPEPELTFLQSSVCLPTTVTIINSSSGVSDYTMEIPGYPFFENFESPLTLDVVYPGYYNAEFVVCKDHVIAELDSYLTCCVEVEYEEAFEGCTPPVASFTVLPDTVVEYVNPVVQFENTSVGQVENIWSFGDGEGSSEVNPEWEYLASGVYNAQLLVVNECGCTDVASQEIHVTTDLYVYVPNSFTPNNDGLNDAWFPSIIGQQLISKYEVWVYNRNGHLVFHSTNPNDVWTGENKVTGQGLHFTGTSDVYSWRIAIKKKDGQGAKIYTGHVTMVR